MGYKTILVCLNEIGRLPQLIAMARDLGAKFSAHISGLYVIPGIDFAPTSAYTAGANFYDGNQIYFQKNQAKVKATFEQAMKQDGLSFDFHALSSVLPHIGREVVKEGRATDLIVVSSTNRDAFSGVEPDFVEQLLIASGRPILVLPPTGETWPSMEDVIIGWDNSREASRAVFDALPFLEAASRTHLVTIDSSARRTVPGASLAEALDRHGVKAKTKNISSEGMNTGEVLMRCAQDQSAGLIVLGAYGHTRFTEFILGGATRHMVQNLNLPLLMSH
jgi:nucleotide-binding universal stress UspA family protein